MVTGGVSHDTLNVLDNKISKHYSFSTGYVMYKIYFDVCCLNRPFDDQSQTRIRLESEAILLILVEIKTKKYKWIGSEVIDYEVAATPDKEKLLKVKDLCMHIDDIIMLNTEIIERGKAIKKMGFNRYDALHLACAEKKKFMCS